VEGPVKERLTGALILVAALVVVVPEMLSGPDPKPAKGEAVPAQAADAGPPLRTYSLVLDSAADTRPAQQATLTPQAPAAAEPVESGKPRTPDAPAAVAVETAPAPVVEAPPPAVVAAAPKPESPPQPQSKPQATAAPAPAAGKWWTQLGSFSSRENAQKLGQQLRAAGFNVDVSKVRAGGKELFRVRAGPVADRADAVALQARLAAAGHKSTLVVP
jgi:DedD protein